MRNLQKIYRITLHGLVLLVAYDISIMANWTIHSWSKPGLAVTLLLFFVLPITLFLIWSFLFRVLRSLGFLALHSKRELLWTWAVSMMYTPLIYLIYGLQGLAPDLETIIRLMILQLPVNAIALLVGRKAILRRDDDETLYRKQPVLTIGCTTFMVILAGLLVLSHIPTFTKMLGELAVARGQKRQLRTLQEAIARWEVVPFAEYRLHVNVSSRSLGTTKAMVRMGDDIRVVDVGELVDSCTYTVEIKDEVVVSTPSNTCSSTPMTVTEFFADIEQTIIEHACGPNGCRCDGYIGVEASYDTAFGYPQTVKMSRMREHLFSYFFEDPYGFLISGCTMTGWGLVLPVFEMELTPIQ